MQSLFVPAAELVKLIIRAETLLALLMAVALFVLARGRLRTGRALLALTLAALLTIGILPVGQLVLLPLERQYASAPSVARIDGIILLGGSEDVGPAKRWQLPLVSASGDRYLATIALATRFPEARILVTGSGVAHLGKAMLRAAGISPQRLLLETGARNTAENARLSRELLGPDLAGRWALVTSAYHMPRAIATFCAAGWSNVVPWPTDYRTSTFWDGVGWDLPVHMDNLNAGVKEWLGLLAYRLSGRLERFNPDGCLFSDAISRAN